MPKNKNPPQSSDSDSGPEDRGPVSKKLKDNAGGSSSNPDVICELGRNRQVRINEFKGRRYLDIREYYMDKSTSDLKPGKKGITLMLDEFNKLVENADAIRKAFSNA